MWNWKTIAALAAFTLAGLSAAAAAEGELRIGTEGAYPPWSMAGADGSVKGFDIDVGNLICAKLGVECKFVVQAFDGLIPALQAHRFDAIISGMSITGERSEKIDFSIGYADLPSMFVVPKDSPVAGIKDYDALKKSLEGLTVGVQVGTTQAQYLAKRMPDVDIKTYDSLDQMEIDLATGRLDASFADLSANNDFLKREDGANFTLVDVRIESSSDPTLGEGVGVGIAKDNVELKAKIDEVVCALLKDGSIGKASKKWFGADASMPCK